MRCFAFLLYTILISAIGASGFVLSAEPAKPHITLIGDYHCHYTTQKEISGIIRQVSSEHPVPVLIEGAYGNVDLSFLSQYPDRHAVINVSDFLLRQGIISGAEYCSVVSSTPHTIHGIDDRKYYLLSYNIFRQVAARDNELKTLLFFLDKKIQTKVPSFCTKEFLALLELQEAVNAGSIDLADYLADLIHRYAQYIQTSNYPQISAFLDQQEKLAGLNPERIEESRKTFFYMCQKSVRRDDMLSLQKYSAQYSINILNAGEYLSFLLSLAGQYKIDESRFKPFFDSLRLESSLMSMTKEVDLETERLKWDILHCSAWTKTEQTAGEMILFKDYCAQLFSFSVPGYKIGLYREKFAQFDFTSLYDLLNKNEPHSLTHNVFSSMLGTAERCFEFYDFAMKRDSLMADNVDEWVSLHPDTSECIVICGTMHLDQLKEELTKRGYMVTVRIPDIPLRSIEPVNRTYIERIMGQPLYIDGLSVSSANLAFACLFSEDPFIEQVAYLDSVVPLQLAIEIALVSSSIDLLTQEADSAQVAADIVMEQIDMILVEFYTASDPYRLKVPSISLSENKLTGFDLQLIDAQTNQPVQQFHITAEIAQNGFHLREAASSGAVTEAASEELKSKFIRSLQGTKTRFDDFLEFAHTRPDEAGPLLFGDTFMRLNRVPGDTVERFHHKNLEVQADGYVMPFQHALDVAININLNDINAKYHRVMRLSALVHNLWRVCCTYDNFSLKQDPASPSVTITYTNEQGRPVRHTGTYGEISAGFIPAVLSEMGITLDDWELQLLTRLIVTSDMFGVIGKEWDADYARAGFTFAAQNANVPFEEYLVLARRLYEADILTIYTSNLTSEPLGDVESLLDISSKMDILLNQTTQVIGIPAEGSAKELFFAALSLPGPDFMRMLTRSMADDKYAAKIFPQALLDLKNISDAATPVVHRDPETKRAINPFIHSINAALLINIGEITNIRALRLAILLHDIGKVKFESFQSQGYAYHAERSSEMLDGVFDQWGIRQYLSDEEVVFIKFLVANHDILN
ncbi:MAG: HD domain-containing protein [Candidatus Auribacter fodinae]|jgi:hypothetical protein|uniref:HD domain-containing protein n=1 Tax=Candidatus Auribacter fodinae TaxID=2093366 RepID=A0A3A4R9H8_9BACT|nr:MAG: HD domain-containing protein [Candidatus Auribacter fodinae]